MGPLGPLDTSSGLASGVLGSGDGPFGASGATPRLPCFFVQPLEPRGNPCLATPGAIMLFKNPGLGLRFLNLEVTADQVLTEVDSVNLGGQEQQTGFREPVVKLGPSSERQVVVKIGEESGSQCAVKEARQEERPASLEVTLGERIPGRRRGLATPRRRCGE
ncbi:hypothetical protein MC885_019472 [Smutsia gigantea]|nr:hypothetical protein MC885_019472 [Smutsia gigantea]